jgi:hypothetical protein
MSTPFTTRLTKAHAAAGLSIKEMAIWFDDMSESVMRTWLLGRTPQAYRRGTAEKNLAFLEQELKSKSARLPLAGSLRQGERHDHVAAIRKRYR